MLFNYINAIYNHIYPALSSVSKNRLQMITYFSSPTGMPPDKFKDQFKSVHLDKKCFRQLA